MPELENPILIAGFDGWGNALDVAKAMAGFLIRKLGAVHFAKVDPDLFYRYDETRPLAHIEEGILKAVNPPGGSLYAVHGGPIGGRDMIILRAHEPALRWGRFVNDLLTLCENLGVGMIITSHAYVRQEGQAGPWQIGVSRTKPGPFARSWIFL